MPKRCSQVHMKHCGPPSPPGTIESAKTVVSVSRLTFTPTDKIKRMPVAFLLSQWLSGFMSQCLNVDDEPCSVAYPVAFRMSQLHGHQPTATPTRLSSTTP